MGYVKLIIIIIIRLDFPPPVGGGWFSTDFPPPVGGGG